MRRVVLKMSQATLGDGLGLNIPAGAEVRKGHKQDRRKPPPADFTYHAGPSIVLLRGRAQASRDASRKGRGAVAELRERVFGHFGSGTRAVPSILPAANSLTKQLLLANWPAASRRARLGTTLARLAPWPPSLRPDRAAEPTKPVACGAICRSQGLTTPAAGREQASVIDVVDGARSRHRSAIA
jgi:hypothetical protein